ncbi:hypothetical protein AgCh_019127 [Apium graveolens]
MRLPDGELRLKIEKLASSLQFPLNKLFVVDGSTRSSHSNCKDEEEIVAVIAHELGHWKLNHTMFTFVAVQILSFSQFGGYTLVRNSKDLFQSFGFDTQPVLIGLFLFQHTVMPLQRVVSFALNLVSRAFEFQEENLSAMNTDPWYSAYHYSHPPLVERLAAIDEPDKKTD